MSEAPNNGARWTDTDDATILLFHPAEAATILGRSLSAVYSRRSLIDVGYADRDRKPRTRLRREYFSTREGPREEAIPPRPQEPAKCRFCPKPQFSRGLCRNCYARVNVLISEGYVSPEIAEKRWLAPSKYGCNQAG